MKEPTLYNTFLAALLGNFVMLVCYSAVAFSVYFSFVGTPGHQSSDFLNDYEARDPWMIACRCMFYLSLLTL
jgi:hypothetical protein